MEVDESVSNQGSRNENNDDDDDDIVKTEYKLPR